ncbi:MAG: tripartite tricarboxylate transporter TctB family protein [Bacillota bacterium]|nr:tripartite tricarboxylate transporter TctB family protein [Bacillota bacterium]
MTNKQRDLLTSVIFLAFGVFMMSCALTIPKKIASDVGSGYVPIVVAGCMIVVSVAKLIITATRKVPTDNKKTKSDDDMMGGVVTILLMLIYMAMFQPVGFILSSAIYLFAQILWLSDSTNRKPVLFAIISIAVPVAVDLLFAYVIQMPLPQGVFGF